jgi:AmmeMemoRadiSam system protein A
MISETDKCLLLRLARTRISDFLLRTKTIEKDDFMIPDSLKVKSGAFVSLYNQGELRGCIGTFSESEMLYVNVGNMAVSAASSDSRFHPVTPAELKQLVIEVSVLSPRKPVSGPGDIILGKHGIYIQKGIQRGTFLPQVAVKQGWNVEQFLGNCSKYKAGLGWDGWMDAELYTYEALVFGSADPGRDC